MKILLVGEYSRLHNSLKEGLVTLGHEVTIIGTGDDFKNFPIDLKLHKKYQKGFSKKLKIALFKLLGIDLNSLSIKKQFFLFKKQLINYDVVQLINESALGIQPKYEIEIIRFLKNNNNKLFLLSCGADSISVQYAFDKIPTYSILTPLFEGKVSKFDFTYILKYITPPYKKLHDFIFKTIDGVIASDLDYHLPLKEYPNYLGLIPNAINTEKLPFSKLIIEEKVVIFHGINRGNYFKKGNDIFEKALTIVSKTHSEKIEVITVESVPYLEYITKYDSAHILLDQVYSYDQGYNALEAMAKGKVVFTGAETEFLKHYNLTENEVAINTTPNAQEIADKLIWLIDNPAKIIEIGVNANTFIVQEHHSIDVAKNYLIFWK